MSETWIAVVGTIIGGLTGSITVVVGNLVQARLQRKSAAEQRRSEADRERRRDLYQERLDAYLAYLQAFHAAHLFLNEWVPEQYRADAALGVEPPIGPGGLALLTEFQPQAQQLRTALAAVRLLNEEPMRETAEIARRLLHEYFEQIRTEGLSLEARNLSDGSARSREGIEKAETAMRAELAALGGGRLRSRDRGVLTDSVPFQPSVLRAR